METFSSTLLAICAGNSSVTGEFPAQRPVTRSFDVFFDLRLNTRMSKQRWARWFEMPSRPSWRHYNDIIFFVKWELGFGLDQANNSSLLKTKASVVRTWTCLQKWSEHSNDSNFYWKYGCSKYLNLHIPPSNLYHNPSTHPQSPTPSPQKYNVRYICGYRAYMDYPTTHIHTYT